jgi:hypothetical protein
LLRKKVFKTFNLSLKNKKKSRKVPSQDSKEDLLTMLLLKPKNGWFVTQ